jgi:long-chain acyl-CoA synthetase
VQLEALLKECPLIGQACVVGDGRPHVAALLVPDPEAATGPDVRAEIAAFVDGVNRRVASAERIAAFEILTDEWLPDSDLLTPTLKLKRRAIHHRYADVIERLYSPDRDDQEVGHGHR